MPARSLLLALTVVLGASCASRTEQATRDAWSSALRNDDGKGGDGDGSERPGSGDEDDGDHKSWEEINDRIASLSERLASGVSTVNFGDVAEDLCGVPVEPVNRDGQLVYHCEPDPPFTLDEMVLEVEVEDSGVIGFVLPNITDEQSAYFIDQARSRLAKPCAQTWTAIPANAENAHEEYYSCPLDSGTVIAVGRFPRDLAANQWHFSLVVLGPG